MYEKPPIPSIDTGLHSPDAMPQAKPFAIKPWRPEKARRSSRRVRKDSSYNSIQGVQKSRKTELKSSKHWRPESDDHGKKPLRLLRPPESK